MPSSPSAPSGLRSLGYDLKDRLVEQKQGASILTRHEYDADGRRTKKIGEEGIRQYVYDDTSLLAEYNQDGVEIAKYDYGADRLIRLTRADEGTRYMTFDGLGSVTGLTNPSGDVTATFHLDAWGNYRFTSELETSHNRFGFTGHYWDKEASLYYAKARYYDPFTARFTQADSFLGTIGDPPSLHRYFYAADNPTFFVDPTGHELLSGGCYNGGACGAPSSTGGATEPEKQVGAFSLGGIHALWDAGVGSVGAAFKAAEIGAKLNYGTMEQKADAVRQLREAAGGAAKEVKERFNLTRQGLADPSQLVSACAELGAQGCAGQMGRIVVEIDMTLPAAKATLDLASKGLSLARSASRPPLEMPSDPYSPDWARYYADNPEAVRFGPGAMREGELSMNPAAGRQVTDPIVVSPEEMLAIAKSVRRQVDKLNTRGLNSSGRAFQAAVSSGDYRVAGTIAHNRMFKRLASRDFRTLSGERVLINRGRVYPPPGVEPSRGYFWRTPDIQYGSPGSLKYRAWDFKGSQSGWPYPDPTGQFADLLDWTKVQPEALFYHWR